MATTKFSHDLLRRVFEVLKERLRTPRVVTTAPECNLICETLGVSYSSAQHIFRFIMFQLVASNKAKFIKRGQWELVFTPVVTLPALDQPPRSMAVERFDWHINHRTPEKPKPTQAQIAAEELLRRGFSDKMAWEVAEEYGVTVKSLLLAIDTVDKPSNPTPASVTAIPYKPKGYLS